MDRGWAEGYEAEEEGGCGGAAVRGGAVEAAERVCEATEDAGDTEDVLSEEESETEADA